MKNRPTLLRWTSLNNVKRSIPIIILVVSMFVISNRVWVALTGQYEEVGILSWAPVTLVANIAVSYLVFMIFTAAAQILLGSKSDGVSIGA